MVLVFQSFFRSNEVYQLSKRFQNLEFYTAIQLLTKSLGICRSILSRNTLDSFEKKIIALETKKPINFFLDLSVNFGSVSVLGQQILIVMF